MTIKKKFIYLFNNTTRCRGQCLDHIVVFGKLIFVVLGIWDGVVPYRVTDETNDKRLGITGRVVKSKILDISGVTYTKVLYKTKTRLSKIPKRGFWNSKKDNTIYGLDLSLLTNPVDLAFLYYYRIMIPSTFTIPSDISGSGILPTIDNNRDFFDEYKQNAELFETAIFDKDRTQKKLVNDYSNSTITVVTTDTSGTNTVTLIGATTNNNSLISTPGLLATYFIDFDLIEPDISNNLNNQKPYYYINNISNLEVFKTNYKLLSLIFQTYKNHKSNALTNSFSIIINYIDSIISGSPPSDPPYNATYEIFAKTNNGEPSDTIPDFRQSFIKNLYIKKSVNSLSVPEYFCLYYDKGNTNRNNLIAKSQTPNSDPSFSPTCDSFYP
jgi:hypothetical protein